MSVVLQEIITLLTSGISQIATGIGAGLSNLVTEIFLKTSETGEVMGVSTFGGVVIIFAGVSLAIGLSTLVVHWLTSLGKSNGM